MANASARRIGRFRPGRLTKGLAWAILAASSLSLTGCMLEEEQWVVAPSRPTKPIPSFDETIGAYAELVSDRGLLVRGYGLVLMPAATGSRECPPGIRKLIVEQLNRLQVGETTSVLAGPSIDEWVESLNTAVVLVQGILPAGAIGRSTFDVTVTALPDSQTSSLDGGVLISTDLSIWRRGEAGMMHGQMLAKAAGPVFINPFAELSQVGSGSATTAPEGAAAVGTPADPRRGWILGGAVIEKDEPITMRFREPSWRVAGNCRDQLNARFSQVDPARRLPLPHRDSVAQVRNPSTMTLKVPPDYRNQVAHWLGLARQVYVDRDPLFIQQRLDLLTAEMTWPDADRARVALTFIALGRIAQGHVQTLYSHKDPAVALWAAYAGLRLGDPLALDVMLRLAKERDCPQQLAAIIALGEPHRFRGVGDGLAELLSVESPVLRSEAFLTMSELGSALIRSQTIGLPRLDFRLDVIRCGGPYLIYCTRTGQPRMALFGGDTLKVASPIFFHNARAGLTIQEAKVKVPKAPAGPFSASASSRIDEYLDDESETRDMLALWRIDPATGRRSSTIHCSYLLADVVRHLGSPPDRDADGKLTGLGLNYSQVLHVLHQLSQAHFIAAGIYLQPLSGPTLELLGGGADSEAGDLGEAGTDSRPDGQRVEVEKPAGNVPKIGN